MVFSLFPRANNNNKKNPFWVALFALAVAVLSAGSSHGFTAPAASLARTHHHHASVPTAVLSAVADAPAKEKQKESTGVEIVKDEDVESDEKTGKNGWEIQLFNDPYNHRTFVAKCLCTICGKSDGESYQIMMQAHRNG